VRLVLLAGVDTEGGQRYVQYGSVLVEGVEVHDAEDDVRAVLGHLGVSQDLRVVRAQEENVVVGLQGR